METRARRSARRACAGFAVAVLVYGIGSGLPFHHAWRSAAAWAAEEGKSGKESAGGRSRSCRSASDRTGHR